MNKPTLRNFTSHLLKTISSILILFPLIFSSCAPNPNLSISLEEQLATGPVWPTISTDDRSWTIGFDQRLELKNDVRQVASLSAWLQERTGLSFSVYIPEPEGNIVSDLCAGNVDFAVIGTVSYLQANQLCGASILVRGRNQDGSDTYRAAIIVAPDSPYQTIQDLLGQSFAFGAPNSTQGHLIPRLMLLQVGINLDDFSAYTYTGSHSATANAVTSRHYEAGALQDTLALDLAERGLVRILAMSEPYPSSGIVAGPNVPEEILEIVRQALLELDPVGQDANALYQWQRTEMPLGFVLAHDDEYEELWQIAQQIGLLSP